MGSWVIWLITAVLLGVAELLTTTLALGLLAAAAAVAAVAGLAGFSLTVQVIAFVVAGVAGLGLIRPFAVGHLRQPPRLRTGTAALIGRSALVLADVSAHAGRVRIGGEEWSARPYDETLQIPAGTTVDVIKIDGATAIVYPRE
jgi:membrane protein implicated in regulation of membrane protease activity